MSSKNPLNNMRKYHNYIKKFYIDKYITTPTNLIDLASGKGGDLLKWKQNKFIKSVDAYDINEESVTEARRRLKDMLIRKPVTFTVKDLSKESIICKKKYDVITSHFAFHYFFKSAKTLETILKTIDTCSKKDTILMLTILDGDKVKDISSENYSLELLNPSKKHGYNRKLNVYIKGSVLDKPEIEYLVSDKFLEKQLSKIGFSLIESKEFSTCDHKKFNLTDEEKVYSFLNKIYIFKKN